jgi:glutamate-1-semialdehyde 2,1-aminomutase
MKTPVKSRRLYQRAVQSIPGGVNSPVRACKSVGAEPLFIQRAEGAEVFDADGNRYIDYIGSWGPMILGHRHPAVTAAIEAVLARGTSFGAPTDLEIELAEMLIAAVPSLEMVRLVNSGTEAAMSAVRLARGYTGRDLIVKFDGCYHGHADTLLVAAGSGVATLGIPGSPGVPEATAGQTFSLPYNDIACFAEFMQRQGDQVACVLVEPVAGNMGLVAPAPGFLKALRKLTTQHGALLVFDEVMTGFRVAYGGAQALYRIKPDLSCFGKIIGGGLPVGAYGGRRKIMSRIAPQGPVYQAGTLSGNPLAMAAGIATLKQLKKKGFYERLEKKSRRLSAGLVRAAAAAGVEAQVGHVGSMLGIFFCAYPVHGFEDAKRCDLKLFSRFYQGMRAEGVYIAPSQFEALFLSAAHTDVQIDATVAAAGRVLTARAKK